MAVETKLYANRNVMKGHDVFFTSQMNIISMEAYKISGSSS